MMNARKISFSYLKTYKIQKIMKTSISKAYQDRETTSTHHKTNKKNKKLTNSLLLNHKVLIIHYIHKYFHSGVKVME